MVGVVKVELDVGGLCYFKRYRFNERHYLYSMLCNFNVSTIKKRLNIT